MVVQIKKDEDWYNMFTPVGFGIKSYYYKSYGRSR